MLKKTIFFPGHWRTISVLLFRQGHKPSQHFIGEPLCSRRTGRGKGRIMNHWGEQKNQQQAAALLQVVRVEHEPQAKHLDHLQHKAGRRSTQRLPDRLLCAQALPEGTRSGPWALKSETCKAYDSNTSSTGPRICFGSPYVLNVIEHYWVVTGDSTPASSWQTHPAAGVCLSTQCSKALEGQRAQTHFILSVWMLLMITMDLLFHINRCPSYIKRAVDEVSENITWRKQK